MTESQHQTPRARHFVTGLLTIIPLGVTAIILVWLVRFLSAIGRYPATQLRELAKRNLQIEADWLKWVDSQWVTDAFAVLVVLALIYFLGMMTSNFIGRHVLNLFESILSRIPFVKTVYGAVKQLVDLMRQGSAGDVPRVVLIEFPSPDMKTVGLVTRTFSDHVTGRKLAAVFVPTTPNPTNGYLEIVPVERIVSTDWSFDEAMSFVVSGGAIAPGKMFFDRPEEKTTLPEAQSSNQPPSGRENA